MTFEIIIVAIVGLIIGSFLNVFILRLNTGRSTAGRSGCMNCGEKLSWNELIPVISFFALRGNCKHCGSAISQQYWLVEITTALLFALVWLQEFSLEATGLALVLVVLLIVIAVYDLKHTIIPNSIVYPFIVFGFLSNTPLWGTFSLEELPLYFLLVLVGGLVTAMPLFILWAVSKGRWMGFGDVKLAVGFGFILGAYEGLMAIMLGFVLGAVIGVFLLHAPKVIKRISLSPTGSRFTMSSEVPFAPFLILGFFLVFLFDVDLIKIFATLL